MKFFPVNNLLYSDSCTIKILKQYLHLSNLNEKIQVSSNLKFLDLIDEAILEEKTSINEKIKNTWSRHILAYRFFFSLRLFILILTAIRRKNTINKFKALRNISLKLIKRYSAMSNIIGLQFQNFFILNKLLNTSIE